MKAITSFLLALLACFVVSCEQGEGDNQRVKPYDSQAGAFVLDEGCVRTNRPPCN
jgi:hypothetical protein